jgi:predicted cation transporter
MISLTGFHSVLTFLKSLNFYEPIIIFIIMCIATTKVVMKFSEKLIFKFSAFLPLSPRMSFFLTVLILGSLLGSIITEPAAMTLSVLILMDTLFDNTSLKFKYMTLSLLLVNISIGGTLSSFAAPPVLMVASKWNWDTMFMFRHFGYKAIIAIFCSTAIFAFILRKELQGKIDQNINAKKVYSIKFKAALLVSLFLTGLIILGAHQGWWLKVLIAKLSELQLYIGATLLTSITDNAALTYLGSMIELSDTQKYSLVAGAVVGGGLTIIANAPNPIAFGLLKEKFII